MYVVSPMHSLAHDDDDVLTSSSQRGSQPQSTQTSFIARIKERVYYYLYGPKPAFLAPLSWILTLQVFAIRVIWYLSVSQLLLTLTSTGAYLTLGS
jgi:hypothetical protein